MSWKALFRAELVGGPHDAEFVDVELGEISHRTKQGSYVRRESPENEARERAKRPLLFDYCGPGAIKVS